MNLTQKLVTLLSLFLFSSCANYINQMHREFDRADGVEAPQQRQRDQFNMYRRQKEVKTQSIINSENNPYVVPSIKRDYKNPNEAPKRYKASDLADNNGDGSLWSGVEGRNNFLFTENEKKSNGDIILLQVAGKLKNEITAELKRAFPAPQKLDAKKVAAPAKAPASESASEDQVDQNSDKIYDRISSVVVEEINQDHLLIRGRKNVLYHNRKRVVEVQALVNRRDINNDDTVNSNRVLESQIVVLR